MTVSIYCMELTAFEMETFTEVAKSCFSNANFDAYDPVQVAALPASVSTCPGIHSQKLKLYCTAVIHC